MTNALAIAVDIPLPLAVVGGLVLLVVGAEVVFGFFYSSN